MAQEFTLSGEGSGIDDAQWNAAPKAMTERVKQAMRAATLARSEGNEQAARELDAHVLDLRGQARTKYQEMYDKADAMTGVRNPASDQYTNDAGRYFAGAGHGLYRLRDSVGNMAGLVDDQRISDRNVQDAPLMATGAGQLGDLTSETAALAAVPEAGLVGMTRFGKPGVKAAEWLMQFAKKSPILTGMGTGAVQGAAMSDPGQRDVGAIAGGLSGGVIPALGELKNFAMRGSATDPRIQPLVDEGILLTPGQRNPNGFVNKIEQLPFMKWFGTGAGRHAAEQNFSHALVQRAAPEGTTIAPGDMQDMLNQAYSAYAGPDAYGAAKGFPIRVSPQGHPLNMPTNAPSTTLKSDLATALQTPTAQPVTGGARKNATRAVMDRYSDFMGQPGPWMSDDLLRLRSDLRGLQRSIVPEDNPSRGLRSLYGSAADAPSQVLNTQLPQDALDALRRSDARYGDYLMLENAAAKAKMRDSPSIGQYIQALKESMPKRDFVLGRGRGASDMADLIHAGHDAFASAADMHTGASNVPSFAVAHMAASHPAGAIPALGALLGSTWRTGRAIAQGATRPQRWASKNADAIALANPKLMALKDALMQELSAGLPAYEVLNHEGLQ